MLGSSADRARFDWQCRRASRRAASDFVALGERAGADQIPANVHTPEGEGV